MKNLKTYVVTIELTQTHEIEVLAPDYDSAKLLAECVWFDSSNDYLIDTSYEITNVDEGDD